MAASHARRNCGHRGFTLIELLIVIAIIGLLASLSAFAGYQALKYTKERAIMAEIQRLSTAIEAYKEAKLQYPPSMASVAFGANGQPAMPPGSNYIPRYNAMQYHLQQGYNGFMSPTYSGLPVNQLVGFQTATVSNFLKQIVFAYPYYNLTPAGKVVRLDLDMIDPAESLVFWLGGFPCPYQNNAFLANKKLVGFSKDNTNPFGLTWSSSTGILPPDQFLALRTSPLFDFDESRLGDCDNDGWYEYYPEKLDLQSAVPTAPYVYFDAASYRTWALPPSIQSQMAPISAYPAAQGIFPNKLNQNQGWAESWGIAMPYARSISGTTIRWVNPNSYQIIAPGFDRQYSTPLGASQLNMLQPTSLVPRILQDLMLPTDPTGYQADRDNFVNFSDQMIGDELSAEGASQLPAGS